ncbi:MAG: DUF4349 domain-containing protein [Gemmataceae bacterium]|nr:DUF4349 domain-containing protein [Gemmataceae bacterium]
MRRWILWASPLLLISMACGEVEQARLARSPASADPPPAPPGVERKAAGDEQPPGVPAADKGEDASKDKPQPVARKIIYTGQVEIVVKDIDQAANRVREITEQFQGYIAGFQIDATMGDRRTAVFTLRLPVAHFQKAIDTLAELGHVTVSRTDSQDVTDQFYDLEARIQTKQDEEKALRELLGKSTDKLENLLMIRKELARVREEIESAQGRLNKLAKLSELTTITVKLHERKDYVPPTAPTFGSRVSDTFSRSTESLVTFLINLALLIVALVPWSPLLLAGLGVLYLAFRRLRRLLSPTVHIPEVIPAESRSRE